MGRRDRRGREALEFARRFESADVLAELLAIAGSPLSPDEVLRRFRAGRVEGAEANEIIPTLFPEPPRFPDRTSPAGCSRTSSDCGMRPPLRGSFSSSGRPSRGRGRQRRRHRVRPDRPVRTLLTSRLSVPGWRWTAAPGTG